MINTMSARSVLTTAVLCCAPIIAGYSLPAAAAAPPANTAHISSYGLNLTVSVDDNRWFPAGGQAPSVLLFSHDIRAYSRFSVDASGPNIGDVQAGTATAGFILGCGVSAGGGTQLGLLPSVGLMNTPGSPTSTSVGLQGNGGISLLPGQETVLVASTASLSSSSSYPFHLAVDGAPINVSACLSPASAVPFVTASLTTTSGNVQTTAYGKQFTF